MKVLFQVDAGAAIGMGHLMRCLALGQGFRDGGIQVVFVTHCESKVLLDRLVNEGFGLHVLIEANRLDESLKILHAEKPDWVVIDGYHFDTQYQKTVKGAEYRVLYIDDNAHLGHYYADIILNQNYGAEKFRYNAEPYTRVLAGTRYALLRREFLDYAGFRREIPAVARKVLITMGGADSENYTLKVVEAVNLIDIPLDVTVVIGSGNPHYESILQKISQGKRNIEVLRAVESMAPLMAWADVAISAGGTTAWELAFMGLPSILCIVAANQENAVNSLARDGVFQTLSWIKDRSVQGIVEAVADLSRLRSAREEMSEKEREMVDGKGTKRVCAAMEKGIFRSEDFSISLRRDIDFGSVTFLNFINLSEEEKGLVLVRRNSDQIRSHMFNNHIISFEEHGRFIEKLRNEGNNFYWMVKESGVPIGVASAQRVDPAARSCFLGIYSMRKGAGTTVLKHFLYLCFSLMKMKTVRCEVLEDNSRACEFYRRNGFLEGGEARFVEKNGSRRKVITLAINAEKYCAPREDNAA